LLVCMWLVFISITSWKVLRCDGSASGDWCAASIEEQMLVLGLLGFLLMAVGVPTVISTCVCSRQALADNRGEEADPKDVEKFEQIEIKVMDSSNPAQSQANLFKAEVSETADSAATAAFPKREASEGSSDAPSTEALNKQVTDSPKVKQQLDWYSTGSRGSGRSLGVHPTVQNLQPALKVRSKPSLTSSRSTASLGSHKSANSAEAGNNLPVVSEAANLPQQHTMP